MQAKHDAPKTLSCAPSGNVIQLPWSRAAQTERSTSWMLIPECQCFEPVCLGKPCAVMHLANSNTDEGAQMEEDRHRNTQDQMLFGRGQPLRGKPKAVVLIYSAPLFEEGNFSLGSEIAPAGCWKLEALLTTRVRSAKMWQTLMPLSKVLSERTVAFCFRVRPHVSGLQ